MSASPRTPRELRDWAATRARRRPEVWLGSPGLGDDDAAGFPLHPPSRQQVRADPDAAHRWLDVWRAFATPAGVWVEREPRDWQPFGTVAVPVRVTVTGSDAVATLGHDVSWPTARRNAEVLLAHWPDAPYLADALVARRGVLRTLDGEDLARLTAVVDWLVAHPDSGLRARQLPVPGVDTKWLERHEGLVRSYVASVSGSADLGLAGEAQRFRVRVLGRDLPGVLRDLTAPIAELARLDWRPDAVLVLENQASLAAMPEIPGVVAVHGRGLAAGQLGQLPWLAAAPRVLYWGDLDSWGFACLARFRQAVPQAQSVLMDAATLRRFVPLAVVEPTSHLVLIEGLTASEREALELVRADRLRLEQERIELAHAVELIRAAISCA